MVVGGCYSGLSGHKSKKVTSSERNASHICRITEGFMARSRRTSAVLNLLKLLGAFRPPKPDQQDLLRYALDGYGVHLFMKTVRMTIQWQDQIETAGRSVGMTNSPKGGMTSREK